MDPDSVSALDLLVLADLHYVRQANHHCPIPERNAHMGLELAERAVRRALRQFQPDAIVLMGDLVDNGLAENAAEDLIAIRTALGQFNIPIVVVPGNHDGPTDRLMAIFGDHLGAHEINGHQLITLATAYDDNDVARFDETDLALVARTTATVPDQPIIVLQHNPIHPRIESSYPYNPSNAEAAKRWYAASNVVLSLSGHYHPGTPADTLDGVCYVTAPALCQAPFRFLHARVHNREVEIHEHSLETHADIPLWDIHCHTHYAYCRDNVTATAAIERARLADLGGVVITEHAGQLYLEREDFWGGKFFDDPDLIRRNRHTPACRMDDYLAEILPLRSDTVLLGLECDGDGQGGITLLDEDRGHWDMLIGAVHWLPHIDPATATTAELHARFMDESEAICRAGVDVLAHPFRYFRRGEMNPPRELYRPMARLLADTGVAAEINFHTQQPDPRFFAACLDEGVKIAFGTDSHSLWEVGELWPHLNVLRQAGCSNGVATVLFTPHGGRNARPQFGRDGQTGTAPTGRPRHD